ncbi:MAG: histidinol-phosphate transaminase [Planctomycetales bacterium]
MSLFRPEIDRIAGYAPGEQPQEAGWVKLNTNENPYPPSPRVVAAIEQAARGRLNVYPDPLATQLRKKAAEAYGVDPEWILPANGSDECLTILLRSFVGPGELVAYPYPSYVLYETLAEIQGGSHARLPLNADWSWDHARCEPIVRRSKLMLVPNPNSPSGNRWSDDEVAALVPPHGVLVLDEAYAEFGDEATGPRLLHSALGERIVVTRTLSKSYSLAGVRMGFALAHPDLIAGMRKVKDSYNCDTLSIAAALAALDDPAWMLQNREKIRATRARLSQSLRDLGFHVVDSRANFVWATRPQKAHRGLYEALKVRKILVRYMRYPDVEGAPGGEVDGLRITVGTDAEVDAMLAALREIG